MKFKNEENNIIIENKNINKKVQNNSKTLLIKMILLIIYLPLYIL